MSVRSSARSRIQSGGLTGLSARGRFGVRRIREAHVLETAEEIAALQLTSPAFSRLRDEILSLQALDNSLDRAGLRTQLSRSDVDHAIRQIDRATTHRSDRFSEPDAERAEVEAGWRHALVLHERQSGLRRALQAAEQEWHQTESEDAFARIREIKVLISNFDILDAQLDGVPAAASSSGPATAGRR